MSKEKDSQCLIGEGYYHFTWALLNKNGDVLIRSGGCEITTEYVIEQKYALNFGKWLVEIFGEKGKNE